MARVCFLVALFLSASASSGHADDAKPGRKYALLIGVKRYDNDNFSNLHYTENDVVGLGKILKTQGFEITLLSDSQPEMLPTRANILKHVERATSGRQPEDILIFAFAGHGLQFEGKDASYFVPRDARPNDSTSMVSLAAVYDKLGSCGAAARLMLVDACRTKVSKDARVQSALDDRSATPPSGVCALFSCSAGQSAMEMNDLRHGLFFYHILRGLEGQARDRHDEVTVLGLAQHAMRRVKESGYNQTPVFKGETTDRTLFRVTPQLLAELAKARTAGMEMVDALGMRFQWVPAGKFTMGSPAIEADRRDDEVQKEVRIEHGFHIGKNEVTFAQFRAFVAATAYKTEPEQDGEGGWGIDEKSKLSSEGRDSRYSWRNVGWLQTDEHPVVNVTWNDATAYCQWLSKRENRIYALPTEAEWEYACRAGSRTAFHSGDDMKSLKEFGNVGAGKFTLPVGSFRANTWGMHDMHGNVAEWCADVAEPRPPGINKKVARGGSWIDEPALARAAFRNFLPASARRYDIGFRVVLKDR